MAHTKPVDKAKLFVGIMYSKDKDIKNIVSELVKKYGRIWLESREFNFKFTEYYMPEMGMNLAKKFYVFEKPIDRSRLGAVKSFTNKLEDRYTKKESRTFNLDPGYVNKTQLVLASAKEGANKIYLGKGIFAHLTYIFANHQWNPTERCFPDFRSDAVKDFFEFLREKL